MCIRDSCMVFEQDIQQFGRKPKDTIFQYINFNRHFISGDVYKRQVTPQVSLSIIRELTNLFTDPNNDLDLDPSFEDTDRKSVV